MKAQRQHGISLLELLLVVLIAATILGGAVMYYSQTMTANRVAQAANLLEQINKAGHEWLGIANSQAVYPKDFSTLDECGGLKCFTAMNLIPCENNSCFKNPWSSVAEAVSVAADSNNPQYMRVTFLQLPAADCARLREQMKDIAPQGAVNQNICLYNSGANSYQISL